MKQEKKSIFSMKLPRGNGTHASLITIVGAYIIYMAYQMIQNTRTGKSSMSMQTTLILAIIMIIAGLGVIGYSLCIWYGIWKRSEAAEKAALESKAPLSKDSEHSSEYNEDDDSALYDEEDTEEGAE